MRATVGPLEQTINHLKSQLETATKDKQDLMSELSRLSGLLDTMQSEASDNVRQLPMLGSGTGTHLAGSDSPDVIQTVIHRLVSMGVFVPHGEEGRRGLDNEEISLASAESGTGNVGTANTGAPWYRRSDSQHRAQA